MALGVGFVPVILCLWMRRCRGEALGEDVGASFSIGSMEVIAMGGVV